MIGGHWLAISLKGLALVLLARDLYGAADNTASYSTARQSRPLSALEDEEPTVEWNTNESG
jgi:hypothetical protein